MTKKQAWVHALRLRTLPLSIAGILTGSAFAYHQHFWNAGVFSLALCTTLLFQIVSNLANDLGDTQKGADNENRVGPTRAVQSGVISQQAMKKAVIFTSVLSFISAALLIYFGSQALSLTAVYFYLGLALACILAAIMYTVGKKAYGYNGLGDLFVFIFFGLVSVVGVYPLFANKIDYLLIIPATTIGAFSAAVLNLNNMRDIENDRVVGKHTLVVKLGRQNAKKYHALLIISGTGAWIAFLTLSQQWIGLVSLLPSILLIKHLVFVNKNNTPKAFDPHLKTVALSTFFTSILYFISVIIDQWI